MRGAEPFSGLVKVVMVRIVVLAHILRRAPRMGVLAHGDDSTHFRMEYSRIHLHPA